MSDSSNSAGRNRAYALIALIIVIAMVNGAAMELVDPSLRYVPWTVFMFLLVLILAYAIKHRKEWN